MVRKKSDIGRLTKGARTAKEVRKRLKKLPKKIICQVPQVPQDPLKFDSIKQEVYENEDTNLQLQIPDQIPQESLYVIKKEVVLLHFEEEEPKISRNIPVATEAQNEVTSTSTNFEPSQNWICEMCTKCCNSRIGLFSHQRKCMKTS